MQSAEMNYIYTINLCNRDYWDETIAAVVHFLELLLSYLLSNALISCR